MFKPGIGVGDIESVVGCAEYTGRLHRIMRVAVPHHHLHAVRSSALVGVAE
jgi:hypothetical protein